MPRCKTLLPLFFVFAFSLVAIACSPARYEYRTVLLMEQEDLAEHMAFSWAGPAVRFTVTDLRSDGPPLLERAVENGVLFPQERIYSEKQDYTYPVATTLERLLNAQFAERAAQSSADVCIVRYDYIQRPLTSDPDMPKASDGDDIEFYQNDIEVQYDFRPTKLDQCPGKYVYTYSGWGGPDIGGETDISARSEAIPGLVDHIQRSFMARMYEREGRRRFAIDMKLDMSPPEPNEASEPPPRPTLNYALDAPFSWLPYMGGYSLEPMEINRSESVRLSAAKSIRDMLRPDLDVQEFSIQTSPDQRSDQGPTNRPVLYIKPLSVALRGERYATAEVHVKLFWTNGAPMVDTKLQGGCEPTPVSRCSIWRQLEDIADYLRHEVPKLMLYAERFPPPEPGAQPKPESQEQ